MKNAPTIQRKTIMQLRREKGLSRAQLAVAVDCSFDTIRGIEQGRSIPGVRIAERLYLFFDLPIGAIQWGKSVDPNSSVA